MLAGRMTDVETKPNRVSAHTLDLGDGADGFSSACYIEVVKKKPTRATKRHARPTFGPHPEDAKEAREAAESARRDEFFSASTSASAVADWLAEPSKKST